MSEAALRRPVDETPQPTGQPPASAVSYNTPGRLIGKLEYRICNFESERSLRSRVSTLLASSYFESCRIVCYWLQCI